MRPFSVNGMKVIACFMARKSSFAPFGSPPRPLHTSLILIGGKEISTHFVALIPIIHLPVLPSVLSLTLIPLPAPKGCRFYSLLLSQASFSSLLLQGTHLTSTLCPDHPWPPSKPFSLSALPGARPPGPARGSGSAWPCIHMEGIAFDSGGFFCHAGSSHCSASSVLTLPDDEPGGMG